VEQEESLIGLVFVLVKEEHRELPQPAGAW
jgi:hypothetical protein